mgnify:CR=1 FL=1
MQPINKIKGYRVMVGLTQEEMAQKIGVSLRAFQNKEQGTTNFTLEDLKKIKSVLEEKGLSVLLEELI